MWKISALKFGSYIWATRGTASQNKQCQPNIKSYMLGVWGLICYLGPHDIGNHPTPVDTCHPRRLPPSNGSQTPVEYHVATHFGLLKHSRVKCKVEGHIPARISDVPSWDVEINFFINFERSAKLVQEQLWENQLWKCKIVAHGIGFR